VVAGREALEEIMKKWFKNLNRRSVMLLGLSAVFGVLAMLGMATLVWLIMK